MEEKSAGREGLSKKQEDEEENDMVFSVVLMSVIGVNLSKAHMSKMNESMSLCMYVCVYVCVCTQVCMYTSMYVFVHVFYHRHNSL